MTSDVVGWLFHCWGQAPRPPLGHGALASAVIYRECKYHSRCAWRFARWYLLFASAGACRYGGRRIYLWGLHTQFIRHCTQLYTHTARHTVCVSLCSCLSLPPPLSLFLSLSLSLSYTLSYTLSLSPAFSDPNQTVCLGHTPLNWISSLIYNFFISLSNSNSHSTDHPLIIIYFLEFHSLSTY